MDPRLTSPAGPRGADRKRAEGRSPWSLAAACLLVGGAAACGDGEAETDPADGGSKLPPPPKAEPFVAAEVTKPPAVDRWEAASISPDGEWIAFQFQGPDTGGIERIGVVRLDGSDFRCVTCDGTIDGGRPTWFPDSRRILMRSFASTFAVADVETGQVVAGEGTEAPGLDLQNRVAVLSPDGTKLAWTKIWVDGYRIVMGDLVHESGAYRVENVHVVHPLPAADDDADAWARAGAWYEAKGFTNGGRSLVYAGTRDHAGNIDTYVLDLATGSVERLTSHADWDEEVEFSRDGEWFVVNSTRGHDILAPIANVPQPAFLTYATVHLFVMLGVAGELYAPHEPYLFDRFGEREGYAGQRLGMGGGDGWAERGGPRWHPDSTRVVWTELLAPGWTEGLGDIEINNDRDKSRLMLGTFTDRAPSSPAPVHPTPMPAWAIPIDRVEPRGDLHTQLDGTFSGSVEIDLQGALIVGSARVTYDGYSWDGEHVLNGTSEATSSGITSGRITTQLELSGEHTGFVDVSLDINGPSATGHIRSSYDGRTLEHVFD